jgi:hypothetical protein
MAPSSSPANLEAERAILGAILLDNRAYRQAAEHSLRVEDFSLDSHRRIYARMIDLAKSSRPVDMITLIEELDRHKDLQPIGDVGYVSSLLDGVPDRPSIANYVEIVRNKSLSRKLVRVAERTLERAMDGEAGDAVLRATEEEIHSLVRENELLADSDRIRVWEQVPTLDQLVAKKVPWIVEGMIPAGGILLFAGESGSYKTWLSLFLAKAVQEGRDFLGRKTVPRPVLYLDRENPLTLIKERCALLNVQPSEKLRLWGGWQSDPPPMIGDRRLLEMADKIQPLIIVDSLIRFHTGDENSATEISRVMSELRRLANAGATVVLQHHKPKAEGTQYRGSSDIKAGVDLCFAINHCRERKVITVQCFKNRFGQETTITVKAQVGDDDAFTVVEDQSLLLHQASEQKLLGILRAQPGISQTELVELAGMPFHKTRQVLQSGLGRLWRVENGDRGRLSHFSIDSESSSSALQSSSSEELKSSTENVQTIEGQL